MNAAAAGSSRFRHLALALAVAASAVPLLALARAELLGYDGYWHAFVARQDDWGMFWEEVRRTAHPPLFFLALKAAVALFGESVAAYRLIPIAATLGSTWLVGRIVERTASRPWLPAIAAFAFGSALTTVTVGLEVRSYALATFFMLGACLALLALAGHGFAAPDRRARVAFALLAGLALLIHYAAAIFLAGCAAAAATVAVVDRDVRARLRAAGRRVWLANLATIGVPAGVFAIEYAVHVASWRQRGFLHVPEFLFGGGEGALAFVWRNTRALFELFVPPLVYRHPTSTLAVTGPGLSAAAAGLLLALALAAVAWIGYRPARGGARPAPARRLPPALLGRYPYGGNLRHQFLLFPFAVVVLALAVDEIAQRTPRRVGALAVGLFAVAAAYNAANWLGHFRVTPGPLWQTRIDRFRELFPAPEAIHADQFNLIHLFTHHHRRRWRFERRVVGRGTVDVWRVGDPGAGGFRVCRDRGQWQLDLANQRTYLRMLGCFEATGARRLTVLRTQQRGGAPRWPLAATAELVAAGAAPAGLRAETVVVEGEDVYAAFVRREGSPP